VDRDFEKRIILADFHLPGTAVALRRLADSTRSYPESGDIGVAWLGVRLRKKQRGSIGIIKQKRDALSKVEGNSRSLRRRAIHFMSGEHMATKAGDVRRREPQVRRTFVA
jgi:hypothetical protein